LQGHIRAVFAAAFLPPWTVIEHAESFWVQDAGGTDRGVALLRHNEETARRSLSARQGAGKRRDVTASILRQGRASTSPALTASGVPLPAALETTHVRNFAQTLYTCELTIEVHHCCLMGKLTGN
jgi:hypothetical protein